MFKRAQMWTSALVVVAAASAWTPAAQARRGYDDCYSCGTVTNVEQVYGRDRHVGGGTVLGAIVGGALGNQVGKGDGRKAATIVGAVAGGAVGHNIEKRNRGEEYRGTRVTVRMDHGGYNSITTYDEDLRPGDRVRLRDGRVYHM